MSEIKRYTVRGGSDWHIIEREDGELVSHLDHLAALAERDEKIAAFSVDAGAVLSSALAERDAEIERLKDSLNDYESDPTVLADALAKARRQERERCARIADAESRKYLSDHREVCEDIAAAIRALGDEP